MIQWGLIKNNLKLMLRNKWILFLMIILPLIVMSVLSYVFEDFLAKDSDVGGIETEFITEIIEPVNIPNHIEAVQLAVYPLPTAMDYYGIVYVVYFAWCGMISLAMVISSERKNRIESRLQITPASKFSLYLGKMIPCFLATIIEIGVTIGLSVLLFGVRWGRIWASAGVLVLMCFTVSAVGVFLFYLFPNIVSGIAFIYIVIMGAGMLGGSFATYMYGLPESVARFSFIYYLNRTLVEFSTMGESDYLLTCIFYLVAMSLFSILLGMILMRKSMEKQ